MAKSSILLNLIQLINYAISKGPPSPFPLNTEGRKCKEDWELLSIQSLWMKYNTAHEAACDEDNGNCYCWNTLAFDWMEESWQNAQLVCKDMGGIGLATIETKEKYQTLIKRYWITVKPHTEYYVGLKAEGGSYEWIGQDTKTKYYIHWSEQATYDGAYGYFTEDGIKTGHDIDSRVSGYICQYGNAEGTTFLESIVDRCNSLSFKHFLDNDICYVLSEDSMAFGFARTKCTALPNGHLAHVKTEQMVHLIHDHFKPPSFAVETMYWVGLEKVPGTSSWMWVNNTGHRDQTAADLPWAAGEPGDWGACGGMMPAWYGVDQGSWLAVTSCDDPFEYICQYSKEENVDQVKNVPVKQITTASPPKSTEETIVRDAYADFGPDIQQSAASIVALEYFAVFIALTFLGYCK